MQLSSRTPESVSQGQMCTRELDRLAIRDSVLVVALEDILSEKD